MHHLGFWKFIQFHNYSSLQDIAEIKDKLEIQKIQTWTALKYFRRIARLNF